MSFSQEVIKKLDEKYRNRFNRALDKIKEHKFTQDQETELKDEENMICVTLNSVSYWLQLLGIDIRISKGDNEVVYLKG